MARLLVEIAESGGDRPVVLIDGHSGSGKSTLARAIVSAWPAAQLVRLDDVYPGWGGLEAGSVIVRERMLAASAPSWTRWDWSAGEWAETHPLDPERPLVVEGSGALSAANRELATLGIWLELDAETRRSRALSRDGGAYEPHWETWARQESEFFERERPDLLADLVIEGHERSVRAAPTPGA